MSDWLAEIQWNEQGLIPVIAQDATTHQVLMLAWMNQESLALTIKKGEAVYWSRSRNKLWHKGEESGHFQKIKEIRLDCDGDTLLLMVEQIGGVACHTGRAHCFYKKWHNNEWQEVDAVLKNPSDIYKKG
ncbi:phosphoribosyl-AMP cyclohydrolase [Ferrovum sp. PN-J185]|uniref:phosphoribosyl-AMP cyclohydrolase n=1 Tax=Ferrovum sp. PN-J185 TaxID=1356306 RepID=UPI00079788A6|nr:phosphoribosyl-AMP cyclohydrolase [Ferrovum sp. PN-J185]KXW56044.1 phosphoribosyl-AMP cyclohydrolase [Ferrovum sp. PN-J185]MCC6068244.1 phosphoribosyl-AMP cyclohydrolase [Ferrovum sp. PN-J185]